MTETGNNGKEEKSILSIGFADYLKQKNEELSLKSADAYLEEALAGVIEAYNFKKPEEVKNAFDEIVKIRYQLIAEQEDCKGTKKELESLREKRRLEREAYSSSLGRLLQKMSEPPIWAGELRENLEIPDIEKDMKEDPVYKGVQKFIESMKKNDDISVPAGPPKGRETDYPSRTKPLSGKTQIDGAPKTADAPPEAEPLPQDAVTGSVPNAEAPVQKPQPSDKDIAEERIRRYNSHLKNHPRKAETQDLHHAAEKYDAAKALYEKGDYEEAAKQSDMANHFLDQDYKAWQNAQEEKLIGKISGLKAVSAPEKSDVEAWGAALEIDEAGKKKVRKIRIRNVAKEEPERVDLVYKSNCRSIAELFANEANAGGVICEVDYLGPPLTEYQDEFDVMADRSMEGVAREHLNVLKEKFAETTGSFWLFEISEERYAQIQNNMGTIDKRILNELEDKKMVIRPSPLSSGYKFKSIPVPVAKHLEGETVVLSNEIYRKISQKVERAENDPAVHVGVIDVLIRNDARKTLFGYKMSGLSDNIARDVNERVEIYKNQKIIMPSMNVKKVDMEANIEKEKSTLHAAHPEPPTAAAKPEPAKPEEPKYALPYAFPEPKPQEELKQSEPADEFEDLGPSKE